MNLSLVGKVDGLQTERLVTVTPGLEVIKLFSCSNQLSMDFFLLINVKMPIIFGVLTFISGKHSILGFLRDCFTHLFFIISFLRHLPDTKCLRNQGRTKGEARVSRPQTS